MLPFMTQFIPRLYLEKDLSANQVVLLQDDHLHYLKNVMRIPAGKPILVFNGRQGEWQTEVIYQGKKGELHLGQQTRLQETEQLSDNVIIFSPVKQLDQILQKTTELGVKVLQPAIMDHSHIRAFGDKRAHSITTEASEQAERLSLPAIQPIQKLNVILQNWDQKRILFFADESRSGQSLEAATKDIKLSSPFGLLIGPEGGFSKAEKEMIAGLPFVRNIHLGPRILKSDTAALAAFTYLQARLGDWL